MFIYSRFKTKQTLTGYTAELRCFQRALIYAIQHTPDKTTSENKIHNQKGHDNTQNTLTHKPKRRNLLSKLTSSTNKLTPNAQSIKKSHKINIRKPF